MHTYHRFSVMQDYLDYFEVSYRLCFLFLQGVQLMYHSEVDPHLAFHAHV